MKRKLLTISALWMSLCPAGGLAYIFYKMGYLGKRFVPDPYNIAEFWLATSIGMLTLIVLVIHLTLLIKGK